VTVFKIKYKVGVAHTRFSMFVGPDLDHLASCGEMLMRNGEFVEYANRVMKLPGVHVQEARDSETMPV
jgi:hypothetical protein